MSLLPRLPNTESSSKVTLKDARRRRRQQENKQEKKETRRKNQQEKKKKKDACGDGDDSMISSFSFLHGGLGSIQRSVFLESPRQGLDRFGGGRCW